MSDQIRPVLLQPRAHVSEQAFRSFDAFLHQPFLDRIALVVGEVARAAKTVEEAQLVGR